MCAMQSVPGLAAGLTHLKTALTKDIATSRIHPIIVTGCLLDIGKTHPSGNIILSLCSSTAAAAVMIKMSGS